MPYVLDTDHLSVLLSENQPDCDRLLARLDEVRPTIVSYQDQVDNT